MAVHDPASEYAQVIIRNNRLQSGWILLIIFLVHMTSFYPFFLLKDLSPKAFTRCLIAGSVLWRSLSRTPGTPLSGYISLNTQSSTGCQSRASVTRNKIVSTGSGSRRYRQSDHPMCSVLYRLLNPSRAAFHAQHQPVP